MRVPGAGRILRQAKSLLTREPDRFLKSVAGVIHVGASTGQERDLYRNHNLRVIWIEPIPEVFETLRSNIKGYDLQAAYQYLVTDQNNTNYSFHVSNNNGASSSILDFKLHKDIWPDVSFERTIMLESITLTAILEREKINVKDYSALILDTQGSELLVLEGAIEVLDAFKFIKIEVPDFESYMGCCQLKDIELFVKKHGFREFSRNKFAERTEGGSYYDIVYERRI